MFCLDTPSVLEVTKKYAEEMQLADRVTYIEAQDVLNTSYGGARYDIIILGQNLLNGLGREKALAILEQVSESLKPTGRVVLNETVSGIDGSPYPYLTSLNMFVTNQGKVHGLSWYTDLFTETGYAAPTLHDVYPFPEKLLISYRNIISHKAKETAPGQKKA